jgi:hypothetical protein
MRRPASRAQVLLDVEFRRRLARALLAELEKAVEVRLRTLPDPVPALWHRARARRRA